VFRSGDREANVLYIETTERVFTKESGMWQFAAAPAASPRISSNSELNSDETDVVDENASLIPI
jgi:hypothetical protein